MPTQLTQLGVNQKRRRRPSNRRRSVSSHSHTTITLKPAPLSSHDFRESLARLSANLVFQNDLFLVGIFARTHPSWLCQKHPWTNNALRRLRLAMSGEPGNPRTLTRYRPPIDHRTRRTTSSERVPLCRTRFIRADRSGVVVTRSFVVSVVKKCPQLNSSVTVSLSSIRFWNSQLVSATSAHA